MYFGIILTEKLFIKLATNLIKYDYEKDIINELIKIFNLTNESFKECYLQDIDISKIPDELYENYYYLQVNYNSFELDDDNFKEIFTVKKLYDLPNEPMFLYIHHNFNNISLKDFNETSESIINKFKVFDLQDKVVMYENIE